MNETLSKRFSALHQTAVDEKAFVKYFKFFRFIEFSHWLFRDSLSASLAPGPEHPGNY